MSGVFSAESAVLLHLETVRVVLLVLHGIVVSLLALRASQSDFHAHNGTSLNIASLYHPGYEKFSQQSTTNNCSEAEKGAEKKPFFTGRIILPHGGAPVNNVFLEFPSFFGYNTRKQRGYLYENHGS